MSARDERLVSRASQLALVRVDVRRAWDARRARHLRAAQLPLVIAWLLVMAFWGWLLWLGRQRMPPVALWTLAIIGLMLLLLGRA